MTRKRKSIFYISCQLGDETLMKHDAVQASFIMMEKYRFERTGKRKWQKMKKRTTGKYYGKTAFPPGYR